jgi:hypothetical protein
MKKHSNKEAVFKAWDELIFLIEYIETLTEHKEIIREIKEIQLQKKEKWEIYYERKEWNAINCNLLKSKDRIITKKLILKWEELIVESYFYLQQARKMGGTLGHKIGPIWSFHKKEKEKFENTILKIKPFNITKNKVINDMEIDIEPKKVTIDTELKNAIKNLVEEESQVRIHLHLHFSNFSTIRIWKSTFLKPHFKGEKVNLVHADNISFYPEWTLCRAGETVCTLIFKGLPKDCTIFDLTEEIPEPGGFHISNIKRNNSDVYHLTIDFNS